MFLLNLESILESIFLALSCLPLHIKNILMEVHSGNVERSIYSYFFLGGIYCYELF